MGKLQWTEIKTVNQFEGAFRTFNALMSRYEKENESILYEIGLTLFRITHFAMTAFLVVHVIS
tara:strand:+ start:535 stop:723 length:189 start_codon:yes stop_codon:yes gene_type:complete